jgi:hypothetical protein
MLPAMDAFWRISLARTYREWPVKTALARLCLATLCLGATTAFLPWRTKAASVLHIEDVHLVFDGSIKNLAFCQAA